MNTRNHIVFFKKMSLLLDRKTQEQRKKASKDISGFIDLDAMLDFLLEVFFFFSNVLHGAKALIFLCMSFIWSVISHMLWVGIIIRASNRTTMCLDCCVYMCYGTALWLLCPSLLFVEVLTHECKISCKAVCAHAGLHSFWEQSAGVSRREEAASWLLLKKCTEIGLKVLL